MIWRRVGREPSASPFNSLMELERHAGIPRNPFVNAGALVVTDRLLTLAGDACGAVLDLLRAESGAAVDVDEEVAASERRDRNAALAHALADFRNLDHDVGSVLDHYVRQCAIRMSCADLALAGGVLARHGMRRDGRAMLTRSDAKRINAVMMTAGNYDASGTFAYRVGLPAMSGIGGGVLAILPGLGAACAWGPGLDDSGNSVAAVAALDAFTTLTGWSVF